MKTSRQPKFRSESEEAEWLYRHRKTAFANWKPAQDIDGKSLTPAEIRDRETHKMKTKAISIRFSEADIELAKQQAKAKGIGYQALIRRLVHESLKAS